MKKVLNIGILIVLSTILYACCKGGLGGDATIIAHPYHHSKQIPGAIVYVKCNATELPGTTPSDYDTKFTSAPADLSIKCTGLKCGDYYFYCVGYDSAIMQTVNGGMNVKIKYSDRKSSSDINMAVTE